MGPPLEPWGGQRGRGSFRHTTRGVLTTLTLSLATGGCALPVLGGFGLNEIFSGASVSATLLSGKGLTEYALDSVTGLDCRLIHGALRSDRKFCEIPGSPATDKDFKGLVSLVSYGAPTLPPGRPAFVDN